MAQRLKFAAALYILLELKSSEKEVYDDDVGVYRRSNAIKYVDINQNGSTDGRGEGVADDASCYPVVITQAGGDHVMLFCSGTWWAKSPDSRY